MITQTTKLTAVEGGTIKEDVAHIRRVMKRRSTGHRVEVTIKGSCWQSVRDELIEGVCSAGHYAADGGNVPGFYIIEHREDDEDWFKEYRYLSVHCERITFIKEGKPRED